MSEPGRIADEDAKRNGENSGGRECEERARCSSTHRRIMQSQMQAHGEHQQREAGIVQCSHDWFVGMHDVEQLRPDDDAGQDLADHHGHRESLPHREQRPEQPCCDDDGDSSHDCTVSVATGWFVLPELVACPL